MVHNCPKCKKEWFCITDMLYQEILGKGECDIEKESICYDCQGMPMLNKLKEDVREQIRSGEAEIIGGKKCQ